MGNFSGDMHDLATGCGYQENDWWYPASCRACTKEDILRRGGSITLT